MLLPNFDINQFMAFTLILMRVSIIMIMVPLFGSQLIPRQIKVAMIMSFSFMLWTVIKIDTSVFPETLVGFIPLLLTEFLIGLSLGLFVRTIFVALQLAGQLVGYQMGMAIANVIDPYSGAQISVMAEFSYIMGLLIFLALNGHYLLIKGLVDSFHLITPGHFSTNQTVFELVMSSAANMFILAVKIGAAPFVILFFTKISMGIIAKTVPQMNVLFVGMPLYIMIGLFIFGLSLTFFTPLLSKALSDAEVSIMALLKAI